MRPETPKIVTHTHDEDYSDEESDSKSEDKNSPENSTSDVQKSLAQTHNNITHIHPEKPKIVTHTHDEDYSDEETDKRNV